MIMILTLKLNVRYLILMLIASYVTLLKYGGFTKVQILKKYTYSFANEYWESKKNTCNNLVYFELGRLPLFVSRKLRIFRYWAKLKRTNNCILKACYDEMVSSGDPWILNIRQELERVGLGYLFEYEILDKTDESVIECRLKDIHQQMILSDILKTRLKV